MPEPLTVVKVKPKRKRRRRARGFWGRLKAERGLYGRIVVLWDWWTELPASKWAIVRMVVLFGAMYKNATNFDMTEGWTLVAASLVEAAGLKKPKG